MEAPPPAPPPRSPLRPPPQPAPTSPSTLSKRQHALHELMSSERAYASDLTLILEVHIPLTDGPMTADDVKIVFGNIGELAELSDVFCEALERTIGSALEDPDATDDHIGELFLRYAPELEAVQATPELTAYHQKTRDLAVSLSHAWDLQSLLIKPVQRLLKYSLLLTAIIDATALTHPDRPHLVNARTTMEEVARQVNEGRRRAEVVKEVLTAPKKPPTLLRIKSFRAPVGDPNSDAARVDRMAAELARIDVFAQQLARTAQEWARAADAAALALLAWAQSFSAAIGLSSTVRSEAFDTFLATLTDSVLPLSSGLLPAIAADLLAPLARLLASAAQPRQLLASMAEHAPLHHHLLTMPLSAKNRPPPALLSASAHYLALRTQVTAELPAQLTPAEAVARAYSEPAPINTESSSSPSSLAYANAGPPSPHYERNSRDREYNQRGEYSYRDSTSRNNRDSSGPSVHTNTSSTSSGKAAHVSNVLAALDPGLGSKRAPAHCNSMSSEYTSTSGGYAAASSSYATSMAVFGDGGVVLVCAVGVFVFAWRGATPYSPGGERAGIAGWNENGSTGRAKSPARGASANGSSGANGSGSGLSRSGSRSGSAPVLANRNGNGASKFDLSKVDPNTFPMGDTGTVRRSHSPTPTTTPTRTVKDGQE
ncbi:Dbl homology domain-containing protein [Mycena olivaceomarginata]|nr:Dbl homology domain-containing protein [Mycena olivaceomarginata]